MWVMGGVDMDPDYNDRYLNNVWYYQLATPQNYMTKTIVIRSRSKTQSGPAGMGFAVIRGNMTIVPAHETIHCSDVDLKSMKCVLIEQNTIGSRVVTSLVGPGSYDNYASLQVYDGAGTNRLRTAGTLNVNFLIMGE
jgi:hypothetical protein